MSLRTLSESVFSRAHTFKAVRYNLEKFRLAKANRGNLRWEIGWSWDCSFPSALRQYRPLTDGIALTRVRALFDHLTYRDRFEIN